MALFTKKPPAVTLTEENWRKLIDCAVHYNEMMCHYARQDAEAGKVSQEETDEMIREWERQQDDLTGIIAQIQEQTGVTEVHFGLPPGVSSVEESVTTTCLKCGKHVHGTLTFDRDRNPIDSSGFMRFDKGDVCDDCLREAGLDPDQPVG